MPISSELLEILVCPACKAKVVLNGEFLECQSCGRRYPVRDDIPIMLIEEGEQNRVKPSAEPPPGPPTESPQAGG